MNDLVKTWENVYIRLFGGQSMLYRSRLSDLLKWDKPSAQKNNDPSGQWIEWSAKISALKNLLSEEYPKIKITVDNKIILGKKTQTRMPLNKHTSQP